MVHFLKIKMKNYFRIFTSNITLKRNENNDNTLSLTNRTLTINFVRIKGVTLVHFNLHLIFYSEHCLTGLYLFRVNTIGVFDHDISRNNLVL